MITRQQRSGHALEIRLPRLADDIAPVKGRIELHIADRDSFDADARGQGRNVVIEERSGQPAGIGMTVEDQDTRAVCHDVANAHQGARGEPRMRRRPTASPT
jgi:hypothetical protein